MRKRKDSTTETPVQDYRYDAKRKNIPPAGLAAQGQIRETPKLHFQYSAHLPPVLRFDPTGGADRLPELLEDALSRPLTPEEARQVADALRNHEPWLEWSGKREQKSFEVDPVALHIHERVSAQAILKVAAREDVQRSLFADPELDYLKAVQFYQHDVAWSNRMILGDSLQVMASLTRREDLAGKVQMIYMDPPYGIKFSSNFQPEIGKRDVRDRDADLTREPEMVKAYRDTWTLGVHSYLSYLRDRLYLCKELLADTGSIFVQIGEANLHRVRAVLDEVFGAHSLCQIIVVKKTSAPTDLLLPGVSDYVLWYAKNKTRVAYFQLYLPKDLGNEGSSTYNMVELPDGAERRVTADEVQDSGLIPEGARVFAASDPSSSHEYRLGKKPFPFKGRFFGPGGRYWSTSPEGMRRLDGCSRWVVVGNTLFFKRYLEDFPVYPLVNIWTDTSSSFAGKLFVVQTVPRIIERCILMTTKPGDLVLDPTCGSGTTAFVAEQWGRRWITVDASRVAIALARQRLMTARYDYYRLRPVNDADRKRNSNGTWLTDPTGEVQERCTFECTTVPHITLKSIAQNAGLDPIFAKHAPILEAKLATLNEALKTVTLDLRTRLETKLFEKQRGEGKKAVTDADRRRWLLPPDNKRFRNSTTVPNDFPGWYEWEVPFDTDEDWTRELSDALEEYRAAWRAKMDEVNACIAANAEVEELVGKPEVVPKVLRVSGPFTVEAVMPAEESLTAESLIGGEPEEMETFCGPETEPQNAEAFLDRMLRLLRAGGVLFPNNKAMSFKRLEPCSGEYIHAEGEWETENGETLAVGVSFGPEFGPVTAYQVENALRSAYQRGFDALVFAGFTFDATAQAAIDADPNPKVRCHKALIRPDVNMGDLLKETPSSQIFTVFGSPRMDVRPWGDGMFEVEMQGVDIYNPVDNNIVATGADKVAAWFLDTDYDGQTFCITQAFFPDKSAWTQLERALKGVVDEGRFDMLSGTLSLPFPPGSHARVAMKVIDPRGNEVMCVRRLPGTSGEREAIYGDR